MGRRGPKPSGVAKSGLIAKVLSVVLDNPDWELTGPVVADILGCRADLAAMYLSRLSRERKIQKVRYGVYRGQAV